MISLLLALLVQQTPQLEANMRVDTDRIPVGGELVVTVQAQSNSADPMQIFLPPLAGLELIARSERSEVATSGTLSRTMVVELRLRGSTPGRWRIGPARIRQGARTVEADALSVEVTGNPGSTTAAVPSLSAAVQRLIAQSRPPRSSQDASISTILSASSAYIGEQVDVVTAAWFPRELRLQLRRPPTVQTPSIDGVYSYPQRSPSGIAASRQVDGRWFDLFVVHQIVFPLTPGRLEVPPATLHYSVPLAFQFFSQEERYAVHSTAVSLEVKPLPTAGRPAGFSGGVGHGITVDRTLTPRAGRAGEPFSVDVVLRGEGNVSLWPPPDVDWPPHLRAYTERVGDKIENNAGRLGGAKTFRYLAIPDSARTASLPALVYQYFDPTTASYTAALAPAVTYLVSPARESAVSRAAPAVLLLKTRPEAATRLLGNLPPWAMVTLVLFPPLIALGGSLRWNRQKRAPVLNRRSDPLAQAERELAGALAQFGPRVSELEGIRLEHALRAAGVDGTIANQANLARERIRASRYGPGASPDRKELIAELRSLIARLQGSGAGEGVRRSIGVTLVLLLVLCVRAGNAQSMPPEQLYERGALTAAAAGFAQRAATDPAVAAHWYNLGATRFRMGASGPALAAWVRAERLSPRDVAIRRALRLVPPPDTRSSRAIWVPPTTPQELWVLAGLLWIVGWIGYALGRKRRWGVVILGGLLIAGAAGGLSVWYRRPLGIVTAEHSLAISPHELAPAVSPVQVGSVVRVISQERGWAMVRDSAGKIGWLPLDVLERI